MLRHTLLVPFAALAVLAGPAGVSVSPPAAPPLATGWAASVAADPSAGLAIAGWQWPLRPAPDRVAHGFDPPARPWLAGHRGVDLVGRSGQVVHAAGTGVVTFVGTVARVGVVSVTSGSLRTTYEPVRPLVRRGAAVSAGQPIGRLAARGSHCLPARCLHWGLLREEDSRWVYLDPLALLGLQRVRLLPLTTLATATEGAAG